MNGRRITELAEWVADIAETKNGEVSSVKMGKYDGDSSRDFALVTMIDGDHEQVYRVISPASEFTNWTIELLDAYSWMKA